MTLSIAKTFKALAAASVLALAAAPASAATPGVSIGSYSTFTGGSWTAGWAFSAATSQQLVGLGVFDYQEDGLYLDHEVGLWDTNGVLLASVVVTSADPLIDSFRYGAITPFTLAAGQTYIVGAADLAYYRDPIPTAGTLTTAPGVAYLGSRYYRGTGLHFPAGATTTKWVGANILLGSAVPEPATWAMMIIGFGAVGGALRASRRRGAVDA